MSLPGLELAQSLDAQDPIKNFRNEFIFPEVRSGATPLYFAGHSVGFCFFWHQT